MRRFIMILILLSLALVCNLSAQQTDTTSVPNLIRYSGTLPGVPGVSAGNPTAVGVTFAIYKQQEGGAPVWQETQNVTPDASGQYNVILGSTTAAGLPSDLFSLQEQRWLGVRVQGQEEQARVMLVSVPYAFKAHEADTLGGLPSSAFVKTAPEGTKTSSSLSKTGADANGEQAQTTSVVPSGSQEGSAWVHDGQTVKLGASTDNVGIGTSTPKEKLEVEGNIHASGSISSGNATVTINGNENAIAVDSVPPTGGVANQLYIIGEDLAGTTPQSKIQVGIGTKTIGGEKVRIFDPAFPTLGISTTVGSLTNIAGLELTVASCPGCFSNFATPGDVVLRADGGRTQDLILTARDSNNGGIRFGTGQACAGGFPCETEKMSLLQSGNFGIGSSNPPTTFAVGNFLNAADQTNPPFQLNNLGDMVKIKQVSYSWPSLPQPALNQVLTVVSTNGGVAGLGWTTPTGGVSGSCDSPGTYFLTKWLTATSVQCSSIYENTNGGPIGPQVGIGTGSTFFSNPSAKVEIVYSDAGDPVPAALRLVDTNDTEGPATQTAIMFSGKFAHFPYVADNARIYSIWDGPGPNQSRLSFQLPGNFGGFNEVLSLIQEGPSVGFNYAGGAAGVNTVNPLATLDVNGGTATYDPIGNIRVFELDPFVAGQSEPVCRNTSTFILSQCSGSSRRFKDQIADMQDGDKLFQLRPVTFFYKPQYDDGSHQLQHGLIAEDVAKIYPDLVEYQKDGQPYTVKYQMLTPMLLNELQKQHALVMTQQNELQGQLQQIQTQQQQLQAQRQEIETLKLQVQTQNASLRARLAKLETYVETQMKTATDISPATTLGGVGGSR